MGTTKTPDECLEYLMSLQADILIHGITERRRNRMIKLLDEFFKSIGEKNIPRSSYCNYWYEG